jgi:hypothetical protein
MTDEPDSQVHAEADSDILLEYEQDTGLYGAVWRAKEVSLGRAVAVKIVHPNMASHFDGLAQARAMVRVESHPNLVKVLRIARVLHPATKLVVDAVVMEWLEGHTLGSHITSHNSITWDEFAETMNGIANGIQHMHAIGLAHGDLHPANIILTEHGPKIIDIDYSKDESLAMLTTMSRDLRMAMDLNSIKFITRAILRSCRMPVTAISSIETRLAAAESIAHFKELLALETVPATANGQSRSIRVQRRFIETLIRSIESSSRITLRDCLMGRARKLISKLRRPEFSLNRPGDEEQYLSRLASYLKAVLPIAKAIALGLYFEKERESNVWIEAITIVANAVGDQRAGLNWWIDLSAYPGIVAFYAGGLGATGGRQYGNLRALFLDAEFFKNGADSHRLSSQVWEKKDSLNSQFNRMVHKRQLHTPVSLHLETSLRSSMKRFCELDIVYQRTFDKFEVLWAMWEFLRVGSAPIGSFMWRQRDSQSVLSEIRTDIRRGEGRACALSNELFNLDIAELDKALVGFDELVEKRSIWN